jgi:hypothetical protein
VQLPAVDGEERMSGEIGRRKPRNRYRTGELCVVCSEPNDAESVKGSVQRGDDPEVAFRVHRKCSMKMFLTRGQRATDNG